MIPPYKAFFFYDESRFLECIKEFSIWCKENYLLLNAVKTKEIIIDFRILKETVHPISIEDQIVETVHHYKYLGITIDDKLNWHEHIKNVYKKVNQRLYFLRKLRSLNIASHILHIFYTATIQSVITFGITCWGGNMTEGDEAKLNRLIRKAGKITKCDLPLLKELYESKTKEKGASILSNVKHPLHKEYITSSRSGRLLSKASRTERYRKSFVPSSIRLLQ